MSGYFKFLWDIPTLIKLVMAKTTKVTNAAYSGTPLQRKLGIKEGMNLLVISSPVPYTEFFEEWPESSALNELSTTKLSVSETQPEASYDFIHLFATTYEELDTGLALARNTITQKGMVWVSWPKKTSGLDSEIGKFEVMRAGQAIGLVDVKVASVNETWSGHKFVIPVKDRTK